MKSILYIDILKDMEKEIKVSEYNIQVDLENDEKYNLLMHGYTGAVDLIKKEVCDALGKNQIASLSEKTKETLISRGYLTTKTIEEEQDFVKLISEKLSRKTYQAKFSFVVTYNCNFKCTYCQEINDKKKTNLAAKKPISKELVDQAYRLMNEIEPDKSKQCNKIKLTGGEIFLDENFEIIEYIVNEGHKRGFTFLAITNGFELNRFKHLLAKDKIYRIQLTLDGNKLTHDSRRLHKSNNSTYETTLESIKIALSRDIVVNVRLNVDKKNKDEIYKVVSEFENLGFYKNPNFAAYVAPLVDLSCRNRIDVMHGDEYLDYFIDAEKHKLGDLFYGQKLNLVNALKVHKRLAFSNVYCPAHQRAYYFDSLGDIYTCALAVANPKGAIGKYNENGLIFNNNYDMWRLRTITNIKECSKCKYALLCGGGCIGEILNNVDDINTKNCNGFPNVLNRLTKEIFQSESYKVL